MARYTALVQVTCVFKVTVDQPTEADASEAVKSISPRDVMRDGQFQGADASMLSIQVSE